MLLGLSLFLNLLLLAAALVVIRRKGGWQFLKARLVSRGVMRDRVLEKYENAYYLNKRELFALYPHDPHDIVLLGDSLTDYCAWNELFGEARLKNRGISGDKLAGVLARLDSVLAVPPAAVFVLIGINDLNEGTEVAALLARYQELLARLRAGAPAARLHVQSVLPVDTFRWRAETNVRITEFNQGLKALAEEAGATYIDLHPLFLDGDRLDDRYTHDGLHLNGTGYVRWKGALAPYLAAL
ncbi:MAG TPA: GDSL-type esterase/lipase family protein [Oscillatoriaceae cyanobacterium]